ncbi:histidine ammonia-lyase [bacterium]|nr:MAG: histidine ammonia-lyase [bacterium]
MSTPELSHSLRIAHLYDDLKIRLQELGNNHNKVTSNRKMVEKALQDGGAHYGINTGFGILANKRINDMELKTLQRNLILSHSVGVGNPIKKELSKLMLQFKIHALAQGFSGVSETTFNRLITLSELDLIPVVPEKGSVGASGDLAPLSHMCLPLIGLGYVWDADGKTQIPAMEALKKHGLEPIELQAKDGLALINGTQFMASYGAYVLEKATHLCKVADLLGAMSLEALQGSIKPFDERIHAIRPHPGQIKTAENVRNLLADSQILESHRDCGKVQDPYCLRCIPQVHGASKDSLNYAVRVVETEINSVTDNPLVFENGDIVSGGNFHGQPLALALDFAAIGLAELASISERRTYLLLEGHDGLPKLLMRETGTNSGFMIPQYTAAALVSENKVLCHPASVDTIPTSLGQEDHVSMGSVSAVKLLQVLQNVEYVLAIELFSSAQALDFRKPLKPGKGVEAAHNFIRSKVAHTEVDRFFNDDIHQCHELIYHPELIRIAEEASKPMNTCVY